MQEFKVKVTATKTFTINAESSEDPVIEETIEDEMWCPGQVDLKIEDISITEIQK